MKITENLIIDINKDIQDKIEAKQGDIKTRFLKITLTNSSLPLDLTGNTVKIYGKKADGTTIFNDVNIVDAIKGQIEVELTSQALAVVGDLQCEIAIFGSDSSKLTSRVFIISVLESLNNDSAIESTNEFTALTQGITKLDAWDAQFQTKYDGLNAEYAQQLTNNTNNITLNSNKIGDISQLNTADKSSLVNAINNNVSQLNDMANSRIKNEYAINLNSNNFPALTNNRRNKKTSYREIIAIGDSHLWGQGSPDSDFAGGLFTSRHIGQPYNGGFGNRLKEYINHKYDFYDSMVSFDNIGSWPSISNNYNVSGLTENDINTTDLNKRSDKIKLISGNLRIQSGVTKIGSTTDANLFTPEARAITETPSDIGYQSTARQQKFGTGLAYFSNENADNFNTSGKEFIEITPNISYTTESGSFTLYKSNGAIYYGYTTADKSNQFIHIRTNILPDWVVSGSLILIPGYGIVKISSISAGNGGKTLFIKNTDDSIITSDLSGCLYPGKKLYYYGNANFKFLYSMKHNASKMFLNVLRNAHGGMVNIYFKSPYDGGVRSTDLKDATVSTASSTYNTNITGYPKVYKVGSAGSLPVVSSPEVTISSNKITIDTYYPANEDAIYVIDWGYKQKGILVFEYGGANTSSTVDTVSNSYVFITRGFFFDNNIVKIHGFGAHTTSMLLGNALDTDRAATNHITELLQYSLTCPLLLIIQAPIVNEYLAQTPLDTFKTNLASIINQFAAFRNSLYPSTLFTDVLFISTVGGKAQEFTGQDTATIKYQDYFDALKAFCIANNYGFVDFHAWFKNAINKGVFDYEMIYDDTIHPSPFANEFIAKELCKIIDLIM